MAASSTFNASWTKTNLAGNETDHADVPTETNAAAPQTRTQQTFVANTFAAITVQTGAVKVGIQPPSDNTGTIVLKGESGDVTHLYLHKTQTCWLSIDPSQSFAFGLLCANTTIIQFVWL